MSGASGSRCMEVEVLHYGVDDFSRVGIPLGFDPLALAFVVERNEEAVDELLFDPPITSENFPEEVLVDLRRQLGPYLHFLE